VKSWTDLQTGVDDCGALLELCAEELDEELMEEARQLLKRVATGVQSLEIQRLLGEPHDADGAILEINSGAGGTDASDWAEMLKRMYLRWADRRGFKSTVVDEQPHDEAGIKS